MIKTVFHFTSWISNTEAMIIFDKYLPSFGFQAEMTLANTSILRKLQKNASPAGVKINTFLHKNINWTKAWIKHLIMLFDDIHSKSIAENYFFLNFFFDNLSIQLSGFKKHVTIFFNQEYPDQRNHLLVYKLTRLLYRKKY